MRDATRVTTFLATAVLVASLAGASGPANASDTPVAQGRGGEILLTEVAPAGPNGRRDGFFELTNRTDQAVDLTGFAVFRCDDEGLRARPTDPEAALRGVVLGAGERRAFPTSRLGSHGYGLIVVDPGGATVDAIAVYTRDPAPTMSECDGHAELPVSTAAALGESWQRVGTTYGADARWVRAERTPGSANVLGETAGPAEAAVRIDEIAAAGPGGRGDDFVELHNTGSALVRLDGWRLFRCTGTGTAPSDALQHVFGPGSALAAGGRLVIGGPGYGGPAAVRTATSLADTVSGALLVTADGHRVDGVGVSSDADTACQTGRDKLPSVLDYRTGQSWQRQRDGRFAIATRTPGASNAAAPATGTTASTRAFSYGKDVGVAVSEIATDPQIGGRERRNFVEIANFGEDAVDISGWTLVACGADGFRRLDDLAVVAAGTTLPPGRAWTAALTGTSVASRADARYEVPLELAGAGVWVQDADGRRVDSVGVYHRNEMDGSIERPSPCTKGLALPTFAVDRLRAETLQRVAFTGDDATDFAPAVASAGRLRAGRVTTNDALVVDALSAARSAAADAAPGQPAGEGTRHPGTPDVGAVAVEVLAAYAGSAPAPLTTLGTAGERAVTAPRLVARDESYDLPYVRLRVRLPDDAATVSWRGRTVGRAQVRLSVWAPASDPDSDGRWRALDETAGRATARDAGADAPVTLRGRVDGAEIRAGVTDLLVQVVPVAQSAAARAPGIAGAVDYDVAIGHLTDTQYYSEAYPEVYASQVAWLAANADARKIGFVTHTGDLIQNWVDPDQPELRARREFELASRMQRTLDEAGIPNSVLPGNHDNKRGVSNALFNDYFGPERYRDRPWYGGSITPDDNSANWSSFDAGGARFVMISLPYAYGEREIAWAEDVVAAHADANIVISTHEHLLPATDEKDAERSTTSRWVSHGDLLWERVVAPHRNVVLVLSGHFHGIGAIVTENAGGIPGHTVLEALADYQEFRTPTGERATGFQRLLQVDLAAGVLAVDTFSVPLGAGASHPYDYGQFVADDGRATTASNERPWRLLAQGLQHRYTEADDAFAVPLALQHAKAVETDALTATAG